MSSRLRSFLTYAVLISTSLAFSGVATAQTTTLTAEGVEQMARVVTERDPGIRNLEIRRAVDLPAVSFSVFYSYRSPNEYTLFASRGTDRAAIVAAADNKFTLYDPTSGGITIIADAAPDLNANFQANNKGQLGWTFNSGKDSKDKAMVNIDFP